MKKTKIIYWVFTAPLLFLMAGGAIPDIIMEAGAVKLIHEQLQYPAYFLPLIGIAKVLGSIAILVPGFPRLKEWAYAGFTYDIASAIISMYAVGIADAFGTVFMCVVLLFIAMSYTFYHKKEKEKAEAAQVRMVL